MHTRQETGWASSAHFYTIGGVLRRLAHPPTVKAGTGTGRAANLGRPRMARLDSWKALSTCLDCALYSYYVCDSTDDIRVVAIGYYPISRSSSESDSRRRRDGGSDGGGDGGYDH